MLKFIGLVCLLAISISAFSQESVNSSGGQASSPQGTVSFSIGQTLSGSIGSQVNSGVIQPYIIDIILSAPESLDVKVYPNPTAEKLILEGDFGPQEYSFLIHNMTGQVLKKGTIGGRKQPVSLAEFTSDTYFISILKEQETVKTFRIVKSH